MLHCWQLIWNWVTLKPSIKIRSKYWWMLLIWPIHITCINKRCYFVVLLSNALSTNWTWPQHVYTMSWRVDPGIKAVISRYLYRETISTLNSRRTTIRFLCNKWIILVIRYSKTRAKTGVMYSLHAIVIIILEMSSHVRTD